MFKIVLALLSMGAFLWGNEIIHVEKDVKIIRDGQEIVAKAHDPLLDHDSVVTGKDSKAKIQFDDGTTFFIGKETVFGVDTFKLDAKKSQAKFSINRGVFRFITGKISKLAPENFTLKTKTAVIGIRGTHAGGFIDEQKSDVIYLGMGQGLVISDGKNTRELTKEGEGVMFEVGKEPGKVIVWKKPKVDRLFAETE